MNEKRYEALWDDFSKEYIKKSDREPIAPPERYVLCYTDEVISENIETFSQDNKCLTVAYSDDQVRYFAGGRSKAIAMIRDNAFKANGFSWSEVRLARWGMPMYEFKRQVEKFGLTMEDLLVS